MVLLRKIGLFVNKNKIELRAIFCVFLALILVLTLEGFRISFSKITEVPTSQSRSRVEGNTVYVDDLLADYHYLKGLNFAEIRNTSIPSGNSTGYYDNDHLVKVTIIYDGKDINNSSLVGAVSPINNENANKYIYYKYYAKERTSNGTLATNTNGDNYIRIELIDNPFSKRPYVNSKEYGFNGWVCNQSEDTTSNLCQNSTMHFNKDDYTRYMDVPLDEESEFTVHLNASWYEADVTTSTSGISSFNSMGMQSIAYTETETIRHTVNAYWKQNYAQMTYRTSYNYNAGYLPVGVFYRTNRNSGTYNYVSQANSVRADRWWGNTTYYVFDADPDAIVANTQYTGGNYTFIPNFNPTGSNEEVTISTYDNTYMNFVEAANGTYSYNEQVQHHITYLPTGANASGFYFQVNNPTSNMIDTGEYYTSTGELCTNASSCRTSYKLIQSNDSTTKSNGQTISLIESSNSDTIDASNYYYLVTRDTNIFRYTYTGNGNNNNSNGLTLTNIQVNKPFTVTGTAVNGTTAQGILNLYNTTFTANNDIVIENIRVRGPNKNLTSDDYKNIELNGDSKTSGVIYANSNNLKIGRNVTPSRGTSYLMAESVFGGTNNAGPSGTSRIIIESGIYYAYHSGAMSGSNNYTLNETTIFGSDYDRVSPNNNKLRFTIGLDGYAGGHHTAGSDSLFASYNIVKSGTFGYNYDGTANTDNTAGMYIGGRSSTCVNSLTGAKVEGGKINTIVGGYGYNGSTTTNSTYIGMSGGSVREIYGGAGHSTTKGNRIINVTGGTISYSILGGSDSFSSTDTDDGVVQGSTLVYVGGITLVGDGSSGTLNGVAPGSVFGAGGGNSNPQATSKGTVYNSHVIINGGTITDSVFGGGNFGSTGTQYNNASSTVIDIYDGTIGKVFGGSKSAGFGKDSFAGSNLIDINIQGGTISNVYGGSDEKGVINGSTDIDITGGTITGNVYGGGKGSQTFVTNNIDVAIGASGLVDKPIINGSVYGGSALGTVNGSTQTNSLSSYNTKVTVNSGSITNVFGGGQGDNSNTPNVFGNVTVDIYNGKIDNVFGGNDLKGTPYGTVIVNIKGGTTTNAYAGGNQTTVTEPYINVTGGSVTNAFGGGNNGAVTTSHVSLTGGTATNVYGGGNNAGATTTYVTLNGTTCTKVFGGSNSSGNVTTSNVTCTSGTATSVYGGNNLGGTTGTTNVIINGGSITNAFGGGESTNVTTKANITLNGEVEYLYGGSNSSGTVTTTNVLVTGNAQDVFGGNNLGGTSITTNVSVTGGTTTNIYGGGKKAETTTSTVTFSSATTTNIFGGGSEAGVTTTNVTAQSGTATNVFGGSNTSGTVTTSNVTCNNVTSTNVFGGNNLGGTTGTTNVIINGNNVTNAYGGGESTDVTTSANITLNGQVTNMFGGSDSSGTVTLANVNVRGTAGEVYGGNNLGGTSITTNVTVDSGTATTIYGGGKKAETTSSTITFNSGTSTNVFGGGSEAGVTTTNVKLGTGTITNTFGGSNTSGTVTTSNITNITNNPNLTGSLSVSNIFGGNNQGGTTGTTNISLSKGNISNVYGGGEQAETNLTNVNITGATINQVVYGGGDNAKVSTNTNVTITSNSKILGNVYGGGNAGIVEGNTNVTITSSSVSQSVYGGGNAATVEGNTNVTVTSSTITNNIFGGGNNGMVLNNTTVDVKNTTVSNSIYAGGNGVTAIVLGSTLLNIEGTTNVTNHVFGGGNAAATGCNADITNGSNEVLAICSNANSSQSEVNIAGATIGGNVYGGANTSVLYGVTTVNIGANTIDTNYNLTSGNISINGTVFGGGEANASGSEDYDFSFISVTTGININIDATNHNTFTINGSIFGSGNASSSGGYSYINIKNYGTHLSPKANISIQRTDIVTLDNSSIILAGATDRTNKYKTELFTFSRIGELKLKNGSTIYLTKGANLLEKFSSLVDSNGSETKETVTINEQSGSVTRNVDNRVYMYEGTNLNISDDESLATYGDVNGMAFFGMFTKDRNGNIVTALYSGAYDANDAVSSTELYYFSSGSYVIGKHKTSHNYYADGFYTHYPNEDGATIKVDYIIPTPESASFYRWVAGEAVESLELTLTASKYSTLGTFELQLLDYYAPNTEIDVLGVNFDNLSPSINLLPSSSIPRHAETTNAANTNFGLAMKTGTTGWITNGETEFTTSGSINYSGTTIYKAENSNAIPSLVFYFYHSKNLTLTQDLGYVTISLMVLTPTSDLSSIPKRINIVVNLNSTLYEGDNYEAAISPGDKYEMFANNAVNITNKSTFSTYFSLYSSSTATIYRQGYYRTLISSYALPVNTKITMIDLAQSSRPEYYYYIINQTDYNASLIELNNQGETHYRLSKFIKMDSSSPNNTYNDATANSTYYDQTKQTAEEEFIFIIDLKDTNLTTDVTGESLLLELREANDSPKIPVLDIEQRRMIYNLYNNKDAVIGATATLSSNNIYIGKSTNLNVVTNFAQQTIGDTTIIDTNFYDQKLGIKITLLDDRGRIVNGASLLGLNYEYDGVTYYPRTDGTTRFNIAERVANVSSRIKINTAGSNLATGDYTILIDAFGSSDGIYYGLESSSQIEIDISIINDIYGLSVNLGDQDVIIDADTGKSEDGNTNLDFTVNYSSGLNNANIRLSLYRRTYSEIYRYTYSLIDYTTMFSTQLTPSSNTNEYIMTTTPSATNRLILSTKDNLTTGTYRLEFKLYDNDVYIGSAYRDIIVLKK